MKAKIVLAGVVILLGGHAISADAETSASDPLAKTPELRCGQLGFVEGTDRYDNCLIVLAATAKLDQSLEIEPIRKCIEIPSMRDCSAFKKCFESPFGAAHCSAFFSRFFAGETIDEQLIDGFNTMMDAKVEAKEQIVERCREKIGDQKDAELTSEKLSECIIVESADLYKSIGDNSSKYYRILLGKKDAYYENTKSYIKDGYNKAYDWWYSTPDEGQVEGGPQNEPRSE